MSNPIKPTQVTDIGDVNALPVEGALEAPIIYFDEVPALGTGPGIGRIVLSALVQDVGPNGEVTTRRKMVAQLRGGGAALNQLRAAIDQIEMMSTPPTGQAN